MRINLKNLPFSLLLPYVFTTSDDTSIKCCCNYCESYFRASSRISVAGMMTRLLAALSEFQIPVGQEIIVFSKTYRSALRLFPGHEVARAWVNLLSLIVLRLRMSGTTPLLPLRAFTTRTEKSLASLTALYCEQSLLGTRKCSQSFVICSFHTGRICGNWY